MFKFNLCILLALVLGLFVQLSVQVIPVPDAVKEYSSKRMERLHHNLFHNVRLNWYKLNETEQRAIAKAGWDPVRPATTYTKNGTEIDLYGEAGEDFLFMHHRMIKKVNEIAAKAEQDAIDAGQPFTHWEVDGWDNCPPPGDSEWPVPTFDTGIPEFNDYLNYYKTDEFYTTKILPAQVWLSKPENLQTLTLGELGVKLEFELHTWFHVRFTSANPVGYREQSVHPTEYIDTKWDNPDYDFLADFYSAHNNPYFWKIHGWIEKRIVDWMDANGLGNPSGNTIADIDKLTWIATWDGGPMDDDTLDLLSEIAEDAKAEALQKDDDDDDSIVGIVLGCVLGGLALIFVFTLALVWMLKGRFMKKQSAYVKTDHQPVVSPTNQALSVNTDQGSGNKYVA